MFPYLVLTRQNLHCIKQNGHMIIILAQIFHIRNNEIYVVIPKKR